jgi:signal transduction histidine kinase
METRLGVQLDTAAVASLQVQADPDQLGQALINLLKNATEASLSRAAEVKPQVWMVARVQSRVLQLQIDDSGPGIAATENLFVPFFTTKPGGSGVGLVLARQVIEAHGGSLSLGNRADGAGCRVSITLPLA